MTNGFTRRDVRLANWREHPYSRWSFQNVSELVPVAPIGMPRGEDEASPSQDGLLDMQLKLPGGAPITALEHLRQSHGDAFIAMRDGQLVAEWHAPHADPDAPHLIFSVSKSVAGLLAGIAVEEGLLDPGAPVTDYVPMPKGGAFASASVRHLLDMTVSLRFEENYLDRQSDFDRYRRAMLWNPEHDAGNTETLEKVLVSLPKDDCGHGERYHYASPATDMLGLVIERAAGRRYHTYLAEKLWKPMGARGLAYVTVDREGTARAAGGICATARDLARLGQLVLRGGAAGGRQVVPRSWIDDIATNGDRHLFAREDGSFPNGHYRSCWYATGDDHGSLAAIGIHEQWIWIDPVRDVVLVKLSSRPEPSNDDATRREIAMLGQIARAI
ncbi:serine hydrolase [Aquibium sp. LZ166]|uniref:Serine hydrolase n=1 Tax=Aquibium pacificus TaxID=3153579 RepID=A0ABV3SN55_9HYPH